MATKRDDKEPVDRPAEANPGPEDEAMESDAPRQSRRNDGGEQAMAASGRIAERGMQQASELGRRGSEQMRSLVGASARAYRDITDFSRGDVDTLMQTSAKLARGIQDVSWEVMQFTQASMRMSMQCANEMLTCRSVEDVVEVQRNFLKDSVDTILQEGARLLEISGHVATDAVSPITERIQQSQGEGATRH
jgi:phasin family protein